jgi:hypothetical protein
MVSAADSEDAKNRITAFLSRGHSSSAAATQ